MARDSKLIAKSLELVFFGSAELTSLIVNDCSAQYGALPEERKLSFGASYNAKTVSFKSVDSGKTGKQAATPALALLALCIELDSIQCMTVNKGMHLPRLAVDNLPTYIQLWIGQREKFLADKKIVESAPATVPA